jgi:hypothetical protein
VHQTPCFRTLISVTRTRASRFHISRKYITDVGGDLWSHNSYQKHAILIRTSNVVWFFFPRAGWLQKDHGLSQLSRFWHFPSFVVATATHCSFIFVSHYLFAGLQDQVMTPNCCALSRNFLSEGLERYLALLVACLSALLLPCAMSICRLGFFYSAAAASQRLSVHPMVIVMEPSSDAQTYSK